MRCCESYRLWMAERVGCLRVEERADGNPLDERVLEVYTMRRMRRPWLVEV